MTVRVSAELLADFGRLDREPGALRAIEDAVRETSPRTARVFTWVVMPDHLHVVVRNGPGRLSTVVERWKRSSAQRVNRALGRKGAVWEREYHDRRLTDDDAVVGAIAYVEANPVRAGLCANPFAWPWSGIHRRLGLEPPQ